MRGTPKKTFYDEKSLRGRTEIQANVPSSGKLTLASDNRLVVPAGYPLQPFDADRAAWETRPRPYSPRSKNAKASTDPAQARPLAPLIDAMLLAGDKTMRGIVRELRRKASAACQGKNLQANVRARIYWLKKRGHQVAVKGRA